MDLPPPSAGEELRPLLRTEPQTDPPLPELISPLLTKETVFRVSSQGTSRRELEPAAKGTGLDDAQRKPSERQVFPSLHLTGGQVKENKTLV